jgi:hypothetical protein
LNIFAPEMAKQLQIWVLVCCLGIFIVPKQYFLAQSSISSCCSISLGKKEKHCNQEHQKKDCHKEGKNKNHCTGNCNNCDVCHFSIAVFRMPAMHELPSILVENPNKKEQFDYITPEFSDIFSKIWQPPKIA